MGFFDKLGSMAQSAVDKSKELAEITKLNLSISNSENKIKEIKSEIGNYVFSNNLLREVPELSELFMRIEERLASIEADRAKIAEIQNASGVKVENPTNNTGNFVYTEQVDENNKNQGM
jgi:hypothetical protein